jgi:predicted component of type VI protein secretion system
VTIGRSPVCDVVLDHAAVSRRHARIQRRGAGYLLRDDDSTNGTVLNGVTVGRAAALRTGDRIAVGPVVLEFRLPGATPSARRPIWFRQAVLAAIVLLVSFLAALVAARRPASGARVERPAEEHEEAVALSQPAPGDLEEARQWYERGRRKLRERRVAPRNLHDAWKAFVQARLLLEKADVRPPLYEELTALIADAERQMDQDCRRLLFTAAQHERYGKGDKAQAVYREMLGHFPGEDPSGCRKKAQESLAPGAEAAEAG